MNNSNPLIPKGSLLEQKNKGRARVKVAVFCVLSLHLLVLSALLIQGCKDKSADQTSDNTAATNTVSAPKSSRAAFRPGVQHRCRANAAAHQHVCAASASSPSC